MTITDKELFVNLHIVQYIIIKTFYNMKTTINLAYLILLYFINFNFIFIIH